MKKLFVIFFVLLFTTNAYAIKFENCYDANSLVKEKIDKIKPSSISKKYKFLEKEKWIDDFEIKDLDNKPVMVMKLETPRTPEKEKLAKEYEQEKTKLLNFHFN